MKERVNYARHHICLILRPALELYPPSINQANILADQGFAVSVVQESSFAEGGASMELDSRIRRYFINNTESPGSFWGRLMRVVAYRRGLRRLVLDLRPDLVIACDAEVAHALGTVLRKIGARLIWHFHEVPEPQQVGLTVKLANHYVWRHAQVPNLIVFPDPGRAEVFARGAGIDGRGITIVANTPRPVTVVPTPRLRTALGDRLPPKARVVLYHGAVGPDHGLEIAIRSLPQWPADAVFVIKGRIRPEYAARLTKLALNLGVRERVIIFDPGFQSVQDHYAVIAGADVGWTVLEPVSAAWKYSALASNKRFECMALGVPQIADQSPLLPELIEGNGCGLCVPHDSVEAAASAVNLILNDPALGQQMGENGRQLHLSRYNYDEQFKPVLEWIKRSEQVVQEVAADMRRR